MNSRASFSKKFFDVPLLFCAKSS